MSMILSGFRVCANSSSCVLVSNISCDSCMVSFFSPFNQPLQYGDDFFDFSASRHPFVI